MMSIDYWVIQGVGLKTNGIEPYVKNEKAIRVLMDIFSHQEQIVNDLQTIIDTGKCEDFNLEEFLRKTYIEGVADLFTFCDKTDTLVYSSTGMDENYLYYPPSMPWEMTPSEPKSVEEVHQRIIRAVRKLTDLTEKEIDDRIVDELYVVCSG